ncbi:MAG: septum formation protein Maf [Clostridia bacterium]|nr:septum formation protein Maf [Clostridia bacterium]
MKTLYLASASPRRSEILTRMQLPHTVYTAPADETLGEGITMENAGEILAARKALAAKQALLAEGRFDEDTMILAADTLVYLDGKPLGKPKDAADAKRMLLLLSGKTHFVCTGTCLVSGGRSISAAEVSAVVMRAFSEEEAEAYVATGEPLDKAGAYGIQGIGSVLIDRIEGDFFSIMGLSPKTVSRLLGVLGTDYFDMIKS